MAKSPDRVCTACLAVATPKRITRGSFAVELVLWFFFIIPGLIYSAWRASTRYFACPLCGSAELVPVGSPRGAQLLESGAAQWRPLI